MRLDLQATPHEVMRAVEALREFAARHGISDSAVFGLTVALEECGANVVNHALGGDAGRNFRVSFDYQDETLRIELRDDGPAFDPTAVPDRVPGEDDEDLPPGGWGVHLVRRYTDSICYTRQNGENILRLIKRLPPAHTAPASETNAPS